MGQYRSLGGRTRSGHLHRILKLRSALSRVPSDPLCVQDEHTSRQIRYANIAESRSVAARLPRTRHACLATHTLRLTPLPQVAAGGGGLMRGLLSAGLDRIGLMGGGGGSKPKPWDAPALCVFVVGGISAAEVREVSGRKLAEAGLRWPLLRGASPKTCSDVRGGAARRLWCCAVVRCGRRRARSWTST